MEHTLAVTSGLRLSFLDQVEPSDFEMFTRRWELTRVFLIPASAQSKTH